jgi:hypothetical protein
MFAFRKAFEAAGTTQAWTAGKRKHHMNNETSKIIRPRVGGFKAECRYQVCTDSVSSVERQSVLNRSLVLLPNFAESECGREWDLFGFAAEAISETAFFAIKLPRRPTGARPVQAHVGEMAKWFCCQAQAVEAELQRNNVYGPYGVNDMDLGSALGLVAEGLGAGERR